MEPLANSKPITEKACSGASEKPVTRSKFSRTSLYSEYLVAPAVRISCATSISAGLLANV